MPFSRPRGIPAEVRAGRHTDRLKRNRCSQWRRALTKSSEAVTGGPSGLFHGKVTSTGSCFVMWAASAKETVSGSGT